MGDFMRKPQEEYQAPRSDYVIMDDGQYSSTHRDIYLKQFETLRAEGKIIGKYEDLKWMGFNGVKKTEMVFSLDAAHYGKCAGREFHISLNRMIDMLKAYVLYNCDQFVFKSISIQLRTIKRFLEGYDGRQYDEPTEHKKAILHFLSFIGLPPYELEKIDRLVVEKPIPVSGQRQLANLINYMAIANETSEMYEMSEIDDEEYIKWFPVYFWTHITFILPLRATEMLVTPFDCIRREKNGRTGENEVWIRIHRTRLKGGHKQVLHEVSKDYRLFEYRLPPSKVVTNIEKYQSLTSRHKRDYLFDYNEKTVKNGLMSLLLYNELLGNFIKEKLIGNHKYDFARYAAGVDEFEIVTAGDSRPIAMANLFYQNAGADICRQLANHVNLDTSAHYTPMYLIQFWHPQ